MLVKQEVGPFVMRFQEPVTKEDIAPVKGQYNPYLQVWECTDGELSQTLPVASFPITEKPSTTSTVITRLGPKQVKTDMGVDD